MPVIDVHVRKAQPETEGVLLERLTDILLTWETSDPTNPKMRAVSWTFLHRPAAVYVAGGPTDAPRYKVFTTVPEGSSTSAVERG